MIQENKDLLSKDHEKAYRDLVNVIRELYPNMTEYQQEKLQGVYPELAKSEDKKWVKWLIGHLKGYINQTDERYAEVCKKAISWLEKQDKQKPVEMIQWKGDNLKEVIGFTGKSDRFDEWFKNWEEFEEYVHKHGNILKLFDRDGSHYEIPVGAWIVKTPDGYNVPSVFTFKQKPAEWSEENLFDWIRKNSRSYVNSEYNEFHNAVEYDGSFDTERMISDLKDYLTSFKPQPKQEWSEEDERMLKEIVSFFKDGTVKLQHDLDLYAGFLEKRLKSLKPQSKCEWSGEDELLLHNIIKDIEQLQSASKIEQLSDIYNKEIDWLKSLKPNQSKIRK